MYNIPFCVVLGVTALLVHQARNWVYGNELFVALFSNIAQQRERYTILKLSHARARMW